MKEKTTVLVVEDEKHMLGIVRDALEEEGFTVLAARDGQSGYEMALKENVGLVVLDVMLPGMDGFEVCSRLRKKKADLPVIILTARSAEADKLRGLGLGADDYVTKPFSVKELVARVRTRLERMRAIAVSKAVPAPETFSFGNVKIDFSAMSASKKGREIVFSKKEYDILRYLIANKGRVITRAKLLQAVWGFETAPLTRTVDTFISRIRKKIEDSPSSPRYLLSIRDAGYKLDV